MNGDRLAGNIGIWEHNLDAKVNPIGSTARDKCAGVSLTASCQPANVEGGKLK